MEGQGRQALQRPGTGLGLLGVQGDPGLAVWLN